MSKLYLFALLSACLPAGGCATGLLWSTRSSTYPQDLVGAEHDGQSLFVRIRYSDNALHTLELQTERWRWTLLDDHDPRTPRPLASAAGHARSELPAGPFMVQVTKEGGLLVLAEGLEPRQVQIPRQRSSPAVQILATPFSVALDAGTLPLQLTVGLGMLLFFVWR